ncbi:MAG: hypothetical protein Q8N61_03195 [bacterium]|nr:hypothetical protein [bacterium]
MFEKREAVIWMFWRWLAVFGLNCLGTGIILVLLFRYLKLAPQKDSMSLIVYLLVWSPLILLANYFFFSAYYLGTQYKDVFQDKYWVINLSNSLAGILVFLFLTWLCFTEVPSKGTLAGLFLSIAAVLVSIFWK